MAGWYQIALDGQVMADRGLSVTGFKRTDSHTST